MLLDGRYWVDFRVKIAGVILDLLLNSHFPDFYLLKLFSLKIIVSVRFLYFLTCARIFSFFSVIGFLKNKQKWILQLRSLRGCSFQEVERGQRII